MHLDCACNNLRNANWNECKQGTLILYHSLHHIHHTKLSRLFHLFRGCTVVSGEIHVKLHKSEEKLMSSNNTRSFYHAGPSKVSFES